MIIQKYLIDLFKKSKDNNDIVFLIKNEDIYQRVKLSFLSCSILKVNSFLVLK